MRSNFRKILFFSVFNRLYPLLPSPSIRLPPCFLLPASCCHPVRCIFLLTASLSDAYFFPLRDFHLSFPRLKRAMAANPAPSTPKISVPEPPVLGSSTPVALQGNFDMGDNVDFTIEGNGSATLSGVTRNKPNCTMRGNGSIDDQTKRAHK